MPDTLYKNNFYLYASKKAKNQWKAEKSFFSQQGEQARPCSSEEEEIVLKQGRYYYLINF